MHNLETTISGGHLSGGHLIAGQFGPITFGPWGIECSDQTGFVTLTDAVRNAQQNGDVWHLPSGRIKVDVSTNRLPDPANAIRVLAQFTALDDVALQDAVVRFVFTQNGIDHADIAHQKFRHVNSDKYRLFAVSHATLVGQMGERITVTLDHASTAGRFRPMMYVRDRDDQWIIHARLLPIDPVDHVWLRWANRFFTLSAPGGLAKAIWSVGFLRKFLWRLRERMGRHCPEIQAVPLNILERGQSLRMEVTCTFR
ncbi:hypothetical protein LPB41_20250 [Thalassospira sp. MA62]|nr:hypothetical protein [Thalassospira sp. MA62]